MLPNYSGSTWLGCLVIHSLSDFLHRLLRVAGCQRANETYVGSLRRLLLPADVVFMPTSKTRVATRSPTTMILKMGKGAGSAATWPHVLGFADLIVVIVGLGHVSPAFLPSQLVVESCAWTKTSVAVQSIVLRRSADFRVVAPRT